MFWGKVVTLGGSIVTFGWLLYTISNPLRNLGKVSTSPPPPLSYWKCQDFERFCYIHSSLNSLSVSRYKWFCSPLELLILFVLMVGWTSFSQHDDDDADFYEDDNDVAPVLLFLTTVLLCRLGCPRATWPPCSSTSSLDSSSSAPSSPAAGS